MHEFLFYNEVYNKIIKKTRIGALSWSVTKIILGPFNFFQNFLLSAKINNNINL